MAENLDLLRKITTAKGLAAKWQMPIQHRRDLYHLEHYKGMSAKVEGETRYCDPTYTNTVDLAVGILQSNDFRWHVYGWSPSEEDTKESSAIEKYLAGTIHVNSLREEEDIRLEITQMFVRDGVAVVYTVWDPQEAEANLSSVEELDPESETATKSSKVYKETPVVMKVIDPMSIWLLPGGNNRWSAVMRHEKMSVWDVEQTYNVKLEEYSIRTDLEKMEMYVEFVDYWEIERIKTKDKYEVRNAYVVDDVVIKDLKKMEGYDSLPYTVGFYTNDMSDSAEHWVKSLTDVLEPSVSMMEIGVNRRQRLIDTYAALPILVKTRPGRDVRLDSTLNTTKLEEGDEVSFANWQGSAPDVSQQLEFFRSRIQQSGFSETMYGSASGTVGSGYAISQESDQNRIRLTQPVTNLQLFWTSWAKKVLSMTEKFAKKSKIRVYGRVRGQDFVTLVPGKDITSYLVECRIRPDFPAEKTRKHAMASQVKGILSEETIMTEYLDVEQPDDEKKRKMIELARSNPVAQQYAMFLNLQELAKNGDEAAAMSIEVLKSQLPKPNESQPGPSPTQPSGLQSATGEATPQAGGMPPPGQSPMDQMNSMAGASPNLKGGV